jgi:hypothetical protein
MIFDPKNQGMMLRLKAIEIADTQFKCIPAPSTAFSERGGCEDIGV